MRKRCKRADVRPCKGLREPIANSQMPTSASAVFLSFISYNKILRDFKTPKFQITWIFLNNSDDSRRLWFFSPKGGVFPR